MTNTAGSRRDDVGRGIILTLLAIFIFATQDAASKFLVQSYSPFQITMMARTASTDMAPKTDTP